MTSSTWSAQQLNILKYAAFPSCVLSFAGSSLLIYSVLVTSSVQKRTSPYRRLIVALSLCDIISSTSQFFGAFTSVWEPGHPTCTLEGFTQVFGILVGGLYNVSLSVYFFVCVCYRMRDATIAKSVEPFFHVFNVLVIGTLLVLGIPLHVYNPVGSTVGCWAQPFPEDCHLLEDVPCERGGEWAPIYDSVIVYLFFVALLALTLPNAIMYFKLRKSFKRNERHTSNIFTSRTPSEPGATSNASASSRAGVDKKLVRAAGSSGPMSNKLRLLVSQSALFCGGFLVTYIISVVLAIVPPSSDDSLTIFFVLAVLGRITFPMQGIFNFLVYVRPRYLERRRFYPDESRRKSFQECLRSSLSRSFLIRDSASRRRAHQEKKALRRRLKNGDDGSSVPSRNGNLNSSISNRHLSVSSDDDNEYIDFDFTNPVWATTVTSQSDVNNGMDSNDTGHIHTKHDDAKQGISRLLEDQPSSTVMTDLERASHESSHVPDEDLSEAVPTTTAMTNIFSRDNSDSGDSNNPVQEIEDLNAIPESLTNFVATVEAHLQENLRDTIDA